MDKTIHHELKYYNEIDNNILKETLLMQHNPCFGQEVSQRVQITSFRGSLLLLTANWSYLLSHILWVHYYHV